MGDYLVLDELGRGNMGVVYACEHRDVPGRRVAVKLLQAHLAEEEDLARFLREGESLARVDHPNVVRVHELNTLPDGRPYLVLDFVEGSTCEDLVRDGPLSEREAARILTDVALGAAHLHRHGIVHRDLKLANVLVDRTGRPVIADFGLVHLVDRATRLTATGELLGTPLYMAPEVILREDEGFDGRVDVYALGVMAYRMIVGRYPYFSKNQTELFTAVLEADLVLPEHLSEDARCVLERALARDPEDRYPTAKDLATDLRALARGEPVSARRLGAEERLRAWVRRHRRLAVGAPLAIVGALLLSIGVAVWLRARARRAVREELSALAERLDREGQRLGSRPPAAAERALAEPLQHARDALARGRALGISEGEAVERLRGLVKFLEGARLRARARKAWIEAWSDGEEKGPLPLTGAKLHSLLEVFSAAPAGPVAQAGARAFEALRARVLLAAGRAADAVRCLEVLGPEPAGVAEDEAEERRWILAWARARAGLPEVEDAPLEVTLFRAETAATPRAREQALAAAQAALEGAEGLEADLGRVELACLRLGGGESAQAVRLLAELRQWSDLQSSQAVPPQVQARAARLEGKVLLGLGWFASAAEAFARALRAAPQDTVRATRLDTEAGPWVSAADAAARLGEALGWARTLEQRRALESAERAQERLEATEAGGLPAALLRREAYDLRARSGEEGPAPEASGEPRGERERAAVAALAVRSARRAGDPKAPPPSRQDAAEAARLMREGCAELAAAEGAWLRGEEEQEARSRAKRARRAYLLALGRGAGARAWAGLALARFWEGNLAAAEEALGRVDFDRAPAEAWLARGLFELVPRSTQEDGAPPERRASAARAFARALECLESRGGKRVLERRAKQWRVLRLAARVLPPGPEPEVIGLLRRASELAEDPPLPPELRLGLARALRLAGEATGDEEVTRLAAARAEAAQADQKKALALRAVLRKGSVDTRARRIEPTKQASEAVFELQHLDPAAGESYYQYAVGFMLTGNPILGFDVYALGFELEPRRFLRLLVEEARRIPQGDRNDPSSVAFSEAYRSNLLRILDDQPPFSRLPLVRDAELRLALAAVRVRLQRVSVPTERLLSALRRAEGLSERRPHLAGAAVLQGMLRLDLGDWAGALRWLERARRMVDPFAWGTKAPADRWILRVFAAECQGWLRHPQEVARLLGNLVCEKRWVPYFCNTPAFWAEPSRPEVLLPPVQELVRRSRTARHTRLLGER
ncbi:MAG: serine/threonine protein kinase [Planctomycetota bacterium]|nr:MAG: serine/threonine protein kinase [Planctomycetota bacterium]